MTKEVVFRRPKLAFGILFMGAAGLWFLCQPAIWTRGYPKIAPVWQAMPWLWVVPVILSAVYDDDRRRRRRSLILFAIAIGFILAGTWGASLIPRRMSYASILMGLPFWGPAVLITALMLEAGWQRLLGRVRCFTDDDRCGKCGYRIRHLTIARCPECGTPFDPRWLQPEANSAEPTAHPWRTRGIVTLAAIGTLSWPVLYSFLAMEWASRQGWSTGKYDWGRGQPAIYVPFARLHEGLTEQGKRDPLSGLSIRFGGEGAERRAWLKAYNGAVNEELAKSGKQSVSMFILSNEPFENAVKAATFFDIPSLPFQIGDHIHLTVGAEAELSVNGIASYLDPLQSPRQFATLPDQGGLVVVRCGDEFLTVLDDGTSVQYFLLSGSTGDLRVLP